MIQSTVQVTDWHAYGHYGFAAYRIFTRQTGNIWEQRHEWRREGQNSTELEPWILSTRGHCARSKPFNGDLSDG